MRAVMVKTVVTAKEKVVSSNKVTVRTVNEQWSYNAGGDARITARPIDIFVEIEVHKGMTSKTIALIPSFSIESIFFGDVIFGTKKT